MWVQSEWKVGEYHIMWGSFSPVSVESSLCLSFGRLLKKKKKKNNFDFILLYTNHDCTWTWTTSSLDFTVKETTNFDFYYSNSFFFPLAKHSLSLSQRPVLALLQWCSSAADWIRWSVWEKFTRKVSNFLGFDRSSISNFSQPNQISEIPPPVGDSDCYFSEKARWVLKLKLWALNF